MEAGSNKHPGSLKNNDSMISDIRPVCGNHGRPAVPAGKKPATGTAVTRKNAANKKIAIAMSGGIDSTMAAKILKDMGFDVFGVTVKFLAENAGENGYEKGSSGMSGNILSARMACRKLSIPHMVIDMSEAFEKYIIRPFCREYLKGLTPNPCVDCNRVIKFGLLLDEIEALGACSIATGHYCRVLCSPETGIYMVKKGLDKKKDQSYFFWKLDQEQLSRIKTPLGDYSKKDIKKMAGRFFPFLKKRGESQDICFIASGSYQTFLKKRTTGMKEGEILDTRGRIIGKHRGYAFYTIGQRKGIGISHPRPLYVMKILPESNRIIVGERHDLDRSSLIASDINFIAGYPPGTEFEAGAKIRYNSAEAPAIIKMISPATAEVRFRAPQNAIAPGQSAVFYDGEILLGGGIISRHIDCGSLQADG